MDLNENLKGISDETIRYVTLRLNDFKFRLVETLSLLCGRLLLFVAVSLFVVLALFFMLAAVVVALSMYVGTVYAFLIMAALLAVIALLLYMLCYNFFVNRMVAELCSIVFTQEEKKDE